MPVGSNVDISLEPVWTLTWYPERSAKRRRRLRWLVVLLVAGLVPWLGGCLAVLVFAYELWPSQEPAQTIFIGMEAPATQARANWLWLDIDGQRWPLRLRWLDSQRVVLANRSLVSNGSVWRPSMRYSELLVTSKAWHRVVPQAIKVHVLGLIQSFSLGFSTQVFYVEEFSPTDFARLRRSVRGLVGKSS